MSVVTQSPFAGPSVAVLTPSGDLLPLPCERWWGAASPGELELLALARPPVLDVGCGPGRLVRALARMGVFALGIDTSSSVVQVAQGSHANVVQRSVFELVPGAGTWATALLLDGNIGIGGDPVSLLQRVSELLGRDGTAIVELEPSGGTVGGIQAARLQVATRTVPWARVDVDAVAPLAVEAGFRVRAVEEREARWFALLEKLPG